MDHKTLIAGICFILIIVVCTGCLNTSEDVNKNIKMEWSRTFGGSNEDTGSFVLSTVDGGCIVTGCTESYGSGESDIWVIKVNESGHEEWNKTYGGSGWDEGKAIEQLHDGSYAIIGRTSSFGYGKTDIWLIKINQTGKEEWNKTYGGSGWDEGNSIKKTDDDGYILVGDTTSYSSGEYDIWLSKVNESGYEEWNTTFGGTGNEGGKSIEKTNDGGYVITGETDSYGSGEADIWLIKVNESGHEEWNTTFGSEDDDSSNEIMQTDDGGFIVVGHNVIKESFKLNGFIVKTDNKGIKQWEKIISMEEATGTSSIVATEDGYIAVGYIGNYGAEQNLLLVKIDLSGNVVWNHTIGGEYGDAGIWIQRSGDKHYYITGYRDKNGMGINDMWLLKIKID